MTTALYIVLFAAGYAASICTWPWIRKTALGVQAEAQILRDKAKALEAKL
jgi:hypothetical protein